MVRQGNWLEAPALLRCCKAVKEAAEEAMQSVCESDGDGGDGPDMMDVAWKVQTAIICMSTFGWLPPLRCSVLLNMVAPEHADEGCLHESCQHPHRCPGTFVKKCPTSGQWLMVASHHKSSRYWGTTGKHAIKCVLPSDFTALLDWHVEHGRALLRSAALASASDEPLPWLFINKHGTRLLSHTLNVVFKQAVLLEGASFGPQKARHVFVTSLRDGVGSVDQNGAASLMGNTLRVWDSTYDLRFREREAEAAMADMAAWREELLGSQPAPPPVSPAAVIASSDDEDGEQFVGECWCSPRLVPPAGGDGVPTHIYFNSDDGEDGDEGEMAWEPAAAVQGAGTPSFAFGDEE